MYIQDNDALERELDALLAREGISVPPDRRAGVVAGYAEFKRMSALVRQPRMAASEPSNIYSLDVILRSV